MQTVITDKEVEALDEHYWRNLALGDEPGATQKQRRTAKQARLILLIVWAYRDLAEYMKDTMTEEQLREFKDWHQEGLNFRKEILGDNI